MGVYIPNMEMPTRCYTCPCADLEFYDCNLMPGTGIEQNKRLDDCPLVEIPPHGDLIDRDYVKEHLYACETNGRPLHKLELCELLDAINDVPTIIPAEEDET